MPKSRQCKKCGVSHIPPTGNKCTRIAQEAATPAVSIEEEILAQLTGMKGAMAGIQHRLIALEEGATSTPEEASEAASGPDCADPGSLQSDQQLSTKVKRRMADLNLLGESSAEEEEEGRGKAAAASTPANRRIRGKKSGRAKTAHDIVVKDLDWPHYYIYRGPKRTAAEYLTVQEFGYGFLCQLIDGHQSEQTAAAMLAAHLRELMRDAMEFPWASVRSFHGILMAEMEMDRTNWDDDELIQRLRTMYVHRALPAPESSPNTKPRDLQFQDGNGGYDKKRQYITWLRAARMRILPTRNWECISTR